MLENLTLTLARKCCKWECNKTIISENVCVFPFVKTPGYHLKCLFSNRIKFKLSDDNCCKTLTSILRQNEQHEQIEIMANHGPFLQEDKK